MTHVSHVSRSCVLLGALLALTHCSKDAGVAPSASTDTDAGVPPVDSPDGGSEAGGQPPSSTRRPNVIFILADDLSMNLVQYMPHVLEMKAKGVTFTNYFVTDSLCCPSRTSILTGKFPARQRCLHEWR